LGTDTVNLIQTLGFPVVAAAAAGVFGYKIVFYVLRNLSQEVKNLYEIIVKLIDRLNGHDKETNKLAKEVAQLRCEVAALYRCMGINPKKPVRRERDD
jgi:cell division protein FtsB|tara:strand:- start:19 stop:312 length:294 start_codon:yes stop_codon:yes gene_type:complete